MESIFEMSDGEFKFSQENSIPKSQDNVFV